MTGRELVVQLHEGEGGRDVFALGVRIALGDGRSLVCDHAVIDTGFSGAVLVPRRALGLETPPDAYTEVIETVGGGTDSLVFPAVVSIPGALEEARQVEVRATDLPGDHWLIGLELLRGWLIDLRTGPDAVDAPALRRSR